MEQFLIWLPIIITFLAVAVLIGAFVKFLRAVKEKVSLPSWYSLISDSKILPGLLGLLFGLIPDLPVISEFESIPAKMIYFSFAGILGMQIVRLSDYLFDKVIPTELKEWIEKKLGTQGGSNADDPKKIDEGIDDDTSG